jgi:hypothetical protein
LAGEEASWAEGAADFAAAEAGTGAGAGALLTAGAAIGAGTRCARVEEACPMAAERLPAPVMSGRVTECTGAGFAPAISVAARTDGPVRPN